MLFFRLEKWNRRGRAQATYLGIASSVCIILFWSLLVSIPVSLAGDGRLFNRFQENSISILSRFTINDDWEFCWNNKADVGNDLFEIILLSTHTDAPVDLVTQKSPGQGAKHQKKRGRYYLKVMSLGKWTITVVQFR